MTNLDDWLEDRLATLHCVYLAGNLGALCDVIYYCNAYKKPLPEWAAIATAKLMQTLANGDEEVPKKWTRWYRQHEQNMADYVNYENVLDVKKGDDCYPGEEANRERGRMTWDSAYDIAAKIKHGVTLDKEHATRDAYLKVNKVFKEDSVLVNACSGMGESPYKYFQLKTFPFRNECGAVSKEMLDWMKNLLNSKRRKKIKNNDL